MMETATLNPTRNSVLMKSASRFSGLYRKSMLRYLYTLNLFSTLRFHVGLDLKQGTLISKESKSTVPDAHKVCQALTIVCVVLSHVQLSTAPLTIASQAPLSV